jgi:ferredoxin-type protein NapF
LGLHGAAGVDPDPVRYSRAAILADAQNALTLRPQCRFRIPCDIAGVRPASQWRFQLSILTQYRFLVTSYRNSRASSMDLMWVKMLQRSNEPNTPMRLGWKKLGAPTASRTFARGLTKAENDPIRPPWSWNENDFVASCTRCNECASACPSAIIVRGKDGFPEIDFTRGACTFCGDCVNVCEPGALVRAHQGSTPWLIKATITGTCLARDQLACFGCGDSCASGAIRFQSRDGRLVPEVDNGLCNGCGACVGWCLSSAIRINAVGAAAPRARAI